MNYAFKAIMVLIVVDSTSQRSLKCFNIYLIVETLASNVFASSSDIEAAMASMVLVRVIVRHCQPSQLQRLIRAGAALDHLAALTSRLW